MVDGLKETGQRVISDGAWFGVYAGDTRLDVVTTRSLGRALFLGRCMNILGRWGISRKMKKLRLQ